jgi:threonine aldolase
VPERSSIDLRSDTITQPTPEMRRAMAEAEVGDDSREGDPSVLRLEAKAAEVTGQEAALFCCSGTMGNLVAFMTHLRPSEEVIAEHQSHFLRYEAGGVSAIAGGICRTLPGRAGRMDLGQLETEIQPGSRHRSRTGLIVAENTHNLAGGTCLDPAYMRQLWELAAAHGIPVHLDGARAWNAAVALAVPVSELTRGCQSVMVDLSKGLAAPYGSVLCGSRDFVARAHANRQRVGGGMRQVGHMAAAGLLAIETMIGRLAEDHAKARRLAEGLHAVRPDMVDLDLVQTNMVVLDTTPVGPAAPLIAKIGKTGVQCHATDSYRIRFVTHRDVSAEQIEQAVVSVGGVLKALRGSASERGV